MHLNLPYFMLFIGSVPQFADNQQGPAFRESSSRGNPSIADVLTLRVVENHGAPPPFIITPAVQQ